MDLITLIGLLAAIFTTIAVIPQTIRTIKTKKTEDISIFALILMALGIILWLIYGILIDSLPLIIANVFVILNGVIIIFFKLKK